MILFAKDAHIKIVNSAMCIFHLIHCILTNDMAKRFRVLRAVLVETEISSKMGRGYDNPYMLTNFCT